ncbi:ABC transporter ATP-binding protein [Enterococcus sp. LJL98]
MTQLSLNNVSYAYKNREEKYVLDQVNMTFEAGCFYAILGPSGSGKSTLLSLLAGLDEPSAGQITIAGQDIKEKGYHYHRKEQVSIVFQNYNLLDYLTPLENIRLINKKAAPQILLELGLNEKEIHRNVLQLSGGQQQRVAIARGLTSEVPIILADEPTGNLDEETADEITKILQETAHLQKKCVIVVTHSKALAKQADVILKLEDRRLVTLKK